MVRFSGARYYEGVLQCSRCKFEAQRKNLRFSKTPGIVYQCPFCHRDIEDLPANMTENNL